jgi:alkylation response protein AidB-like acyl-CoA dehydrogenase
MTSERLAYPLLESEYEMLRTSLRGLCNDLTEVDPAAPLDPSVLTQLALRDLLSDDDAAPDLEWLAWLVMFEELGPSPIGAGLLARVGLGAVMMHLLGGGSARAAELRDASLSGEIRLALAIQEPGPRWAHGEYATTATGGSTPRLSGSKRAVAQASTSDVLVVVATGEAGTHLYAVDRAAEEVGVVDAPTIDASLAVSAVHLDGAPAERLSAGDLGEGPLAWALSFSRLAIAAMCVGSASRALALAVDYLQDRRQFGKALREYQAVSHRCGRSRIRLEQMRALATRAALEGAHRDWPALPHSAAVARMFCADGYASITAEAMRAEGAIGITWENALALHYRRAHWLRELLGGRAIERRLILDEAVRLAAG